MATVGFLQRLFGRADASNAKRPEPKSAAAIRSGMMSDLVKLAGTTTSGKAAITALAAQLDPTDDGYFECRGVLQRERNNPADPAAVAVVVEGERVGYLPGYLAKTIDLPTGTARAVHLQVFTQLLERGLRAEAWAWLGKGPAQWEWSAQRRPPLSTDAKRLAEHSERDKMVKEALSSGGERAEQFRAGMSDGIHYLQTVEPIKQLKREGRLEEALKLCYLAIEGAEQAAKREKLQPAPFYTEQAAIVHRKLGQRHEEIAVLRRYVAACPPRYRDNALKARLDKLLN